MRRDDYLPGSWNAICWSCGRKYKAAELWKRWKGNWVCRSCWEPRHPQEFVRDAPTETAPPWVQPPGEDTFALFCTPDGISGIPFYAIPGCAIPGYVSPAAIGPFI